MNGFLGKEKPHVRQLNGEEEIQNLRPHPLTLFWLEIPALGRIEV